jgi:hypothetical protein
MAGRHFMDMPDHKATSRDNSHESPLCIFLSAVQFLAHVVFDVVIDDEIQLISIDPSKK